MQKEIASSLWKKWGPYLSERQWGTVREDYSSTGEAWDYLSHELARSRAYRWGEDGIAGFSDDRQSLCLGVGLWNHKDPILKERMFGLTGVEGNHSEDVKEVYYYLDATPSHDYLKMLYKYPQAAFPYQQLVDGNRTGKESPEYELVDTGVFKEDRYFDVFIEYARPRPDDTLIEATIVNHGPEPAALTFLQQLWFRNTWSWGNNDQAKPRMHGVDSIGLEIHHEALGHLYFHAENPDDLIFTDNESRPEHRLGSKPQGYWKDAFHEYLVHGNSKAINPNGQGTKCAMLHRLKLEAGETRKLRFRLTSQKAIKPFEGFDETFQQIRNSADRFYGHLQENIESPDERLIQRQAFAGLIWSKQFYYYDVEKWIAGDPGQPAPSALRHHGRNHEWLHLKNADIISMPDKWEYPWYAAWDLAFHCVPFALIDTEFAKEQMLLMLQESYLHPNGQIPAYEWSFGDVNPPVHAWGAWRVYQMDRKRNGFADRRFLEQVFHKLLLNFTWWVNRKDVGNRNVFQGGFLGLDNIGVFDRSIPVPGGGQLDQADGTAWMAMYSLNMMRIALELSLQNPVYQEIAIKFLNHFLAIAKAMTNIGESGISLWDEEDEFFYDVLHFPEEKPIHVKVRSIVGLIPIFAVEVLEPELLERVPRFNEHLDWILENRPELASLVSRWNEPGRGHRHLFSLLRGSRLKCLLRRMLDEDEFLSPYGIRSMSKIHEKHPYVLHCEGKTKHCNGSSKVDYQPAESNTHMFGGNSNWRGPIWFPVNFLLIESLQRFHHYYGSDFKVESPSSSGQKLTLEEVAEDISTRLGDLFRRDDQGHRPIYKHHPDIQLNPQFKDCIWFYEYFHGDSGRGVGACHQTGWTALIAKLLQPRVKEN